MQDQHHLFQNCINFSLFPSSSSKQIVSFLYLQLSLWIYKCLTECMTSYDYWFVPMINNFGYFINHYRFSKNCSFQNIFIVPLEKDISFKLYSFTLLSPGVIVAHFNPTFIFFISLRASEVT